MTHVICRLTVKNRDQLRNPTFGNRVRASFFSRCSTSAQLLHGCSAADASPASAALTSLVPYTNRLFGHQRRFTKRLTNGGIQGDVARAVVVCRYTNSHPPPKDVKMLARIQVTMTSVVSNSNITTEAFFCNTLRCFCCLQM